VIRRKGPWRHLEAVKIRHARLGGLVQSSPLLEPIGYVPPAEYEARYHEQTPAA
jgi:hypothetical protein